MTAHKYTEWGGVRIGHSDKLALELVWPSTHLTVTENDIKLRVLWKKYYFKKASILSIVKYNGLLWPSGRGIKISHTKNNHSKFIVFWTFSREALLSELKRFGYPIDYRIVDSLV